MRRSYIILCAGAVIGGLLTTTGCSSPGNSEVNEQQLVKNPTGPAASAPSAQSAAQNPQSGIKDNGVVEPTPAGQGLPTPGK
jgi:uncharacterized protein YcfL